ncbi:hypothetical protein GUY59_46355, partial [Nonomuraea sp. K271]|nr:hypothetical protein [Nonomuraea sp. K271]
HPTGAHDAFPAPATAALAGAPGPLASPVNAGWFPDGGVPGRTSGNVPDHTSGSGADPDSSGRDRTSGGPYRGRRRRHERLAEEPAFASDLPSRGRRHRRQQPGPPDVHGPRPGGAPQPARAPYAGRQEQGQHGPAGRAQSRRPGEARGAEAFVQDLPLRGRRHRRTTRPDDGRQLAGAGATRPGRGRHRA